MPDLLPAHFVFSQSNLQTYVNCRRKFLLKYVSKLDWPAQQTRDSLPFEQDTAAGIRFHGMVHQLFLGVDVEVVRTLAEHDPDERVAGWLEAFLEGGYLNLPGQLWPEHNLRANLGGYNLLAKVDLLQLHGNKAAIFDWKTSRRAPDPRRLHARLQTRLYPVVLRLCLAHGVFNPSAPGVGMPGESIIPVNPQAISEQPIEMTYWEACQPEQPIILNLTAGKLDEHAQFLLELINEIYSLDEQDFFRATDESHCRYCEYRSLCDRGVMAGAWDAGLDDWLPDPDNPGMPGLPHQEPL